MTKKRIIKDKKSEESENFNQSNESLTRSYVSAIKGRKAAATKRAFGSKGKASHYSIKKNDLAVFVSTASHKMLMPIGKRSANNIFEIIDNSREGLSYKEFNEVKSKLNLTNEDWCNVLNISERTLQRYHKEQKSFDSLQSEKIYQIAILFDFGVSVFGAEEKFLSWLDRENIPLGKVKPKSLFDTGFGINLVETELNRIEHGILA